ncbi:beta-N-acetylhexosaminidase [Metabacillus sp. B2-18]|uniref:beta-N-acetylhexosaminidase n=1 Tax=Metabacillus sp. B2-18 TaxID=2897333 RepID=UPI001E4BACC6|nr:beta-N-acetylhexosaminidase [Metabacillus sp. B2-18]UGB30501.1 beta-N-acetylhexosaminidase [Metabacillus sp. B2-18]
MRRSRKRKLYKLQLVVAISTLIAICTGFLVFAILDQTNSSAGPKSEAVEQPKVSNEKTEDSSNEVKTEPKEEPVTDEKGQESKEKVAQTLSSENSIEQKVDAILSEMTLQEKIGQMMVVGFNSTSIDDHITKMIKEYHVGGVILFDRNMENQEQVASLNGDLQQLSKDANGLPLILSIDQEGGQIVRMRDQVSPIPSQQELGQKNDPKEVYTTAQRTGKELLSMGFTVNFAPVLDLSATDSRSFGKDPKKVDSLGRQVVAGMMDSGITTTLKHFPGNGRSDVDPHVETSSVEADKLDLENSDIYPFKQMIKDVDNDQFFVMVTHIKYPAYDKENPASISKVIMTDLLKKQLGFKGLVVTDDLEMGAVNKYFTYEDLGAQAIAAGADLLLVCHTLENQKAVFNGILKAVESKEISEERIDDAVRKILTHKLSRQ